MSRHEYRVKASELLTQARVEPNPDVRNTLLKIAEGYGHLAELAEKNLAKPIIVPPEQIPRTGNSSEA